MPKDTAHPHGYCICFIQGEHYCSLSEYLPNSELWVLKHTRARGIMLADLREMVCHARPQSEIYLLG